MYDRYSASAYPFIHGATVGMFGEFTEVSDRRWTLGALGRLHQAAAFVPSESMLRGGLELALRDRFFEFPRASVH